MLEFQAEHVVQTGANKVSALVDGPTVEELTKGIWERMTQSESQIESAFFEVGNFLCFLDSSSKLPSSLLVNGLVLHEKREEIILIREKLSKISQKMTLDNSILLKIKQSCAEIKFKPCKWQHRTIELGMHMDPEHLAEQAVGLNLKLMKWRQAPEI